MRNFFLILIVLFFALTGFAQKQLPTPKDVEYGSDFIPAGIFLRIPRDNNPKEINLGISLHVGKKLDAKYKDFDINKFETYQDRPLLDRRMSEIEEFLLAQAVAGKLTKEEVAALTADLTATQQRILASTDKLVDILIKAEYPFDPPLTAVPKK